MTQRRITDDLHALLGVLPPAVAEAVTRANNSDNLLEIILDLGRASEISMPTTAPGWNGPYTASQPSATGATTSSA